MRNNTTKNLNLNNINEETIVATSTPPGRGGITIVRLSGKKVLSISQKIIPKKLKPRYAQFTYFYNEKNEIIDEGIALFFPTPHSFTGEDILECHLHGNPIIANQLIQSILKLGARLAKPGEFSERAFLNHRLDLIQAEAVADLINASSEQATKNAIRSLQGIFSEKIHQLLKQLIEIRVYIEAEIDFTEEEIHFLDEKLIQEKLSSLIKILNEIKQNAQCGNIFSNGLHVVIFGEPNVGKSSLLNLFSQRESAIVTEIPGTTRDILRESIQIDGIPIHLIDTAGFRQSDDPIEQEGIRRAKIEIKKADLVLVMLEAKPNFNININKFITPHTHAKYLFIRNKIDLIHEKPSVINKNDYSIISLSVKTKNGFNLLIEEIKKQFNLNQTDSETIFSARQRHIDALTEAHDYLIQSLLHISSIEREFLSENLRLAQLALNKITGEFTTDDLLGKIFSSFCIGK